MLDHQLINADSGNVERYTPPHIVEAARVCLGEIDLDPASSERANLTVKARRIITREEDGLSQTWHGRVWLNRPYGKSTNKAWIDKLVREFYLGHISAACCITFASTSEAWFQPLTSFPQCLIRGRVSFENPDDPDDDGGATKGSVVTYLGSGVAAFYYAFRSLGEIKVALVEADLERLVGVQMELPTGV